MIAMANIHGEWRWCERMASIARPVRYGIRTVATIAPKASRNETVTARRYGRKNVSRRRNVTILH